MAEPRAQIEISAVDRTAAAFAQVKRNLESLDAPFMRINQVLGVVTGGAVAGFAGAMLRAAEQAEQSTARMNAVLKATGNQSGFTARQLEALADQMARATTFDDESFRDATAQILKFGNVAGEQFKKLLTLSADYAALNKTDVASAAETLGRALASPSQGIERLQRSIGYLNPALIASIKEMEQMGDTLGAQDKVLKAIEERIGGTAGEMNKGLTGSVKALTKAFNELFESGGRSGSTIVSDNLDFLTGKVRALTNFIESKQKTIDIMLLLGGLVGGGPLGLLKQIDFLGDRVPQVGAADPNASAILAGRNSARADADAERRLMEELARHNKWYAEQQKKNAEEALREKERLRQLDAAGWVAHIEEMKRQEEAALNAEAKRWDEYYAVKERMRQEDERGMLDAIDKQREAEDEALRRAGDFPSQTALYVQNLIDVWDEASSRGANFFNDLIFSGEAAFDVLKRHLKSFASEMIALFAKKWILQLGAAALGSTSLGAMAAGVGEGTLAGSMGNFLGIGNLFTGGSGGALGWLGSTIGGSFGGGLTMASQVGAFSGLTNGAAMFAGGNFAAGIGSMIPGIGAIIAIGSMLYSMFKDGPENPNFRIFQGQGGAGSFGGISAQGNFNMGAGWDQLLKYVGGLDTRFAAILGPEGAAAASARLSAYTGTGLRTDGQPAQFAIPPGAEREGAEQIAKELLQSRYGILFEEIDKGIAEQIRAWSGTSTDLQAFIEQTLAIIEGLSGSGIKGLDISALKAMQREGEDLGQTFQRVGGQWAQFNELFTTEAERLTAAQDAVTKTFGDLGIAVPSSMQAFEDLVRGLDLSTDAGRTLFEALLDVAPAFAAVSNAASNAWANLQGIIGNIQGPGYQQGALQSTLNSAVAQFQAANPWAQQYNTQGVIGQLLTIGQQDFMNYSQGNQALITQILSTYEQLNQMGQGGGAITQVNTGFQELAQATTDLTAGIKDWLEEITGGSLSILTPEQRLQSAQESYVEALLAAKGGNANALSMLPQLATAYLGAAQDFYAGGAQYTAIYQAVIEAMKALQNGPGPVFDPMLEPLLAQIKALLEQQLAASQANAQLVADAVAISMRR